MKPDLQDLSKAASIFHPHGQHNQYSLKNVMKLKVGEEMVYVTSKTAEGYLPTTVIPTGIPTNIDLNKRNMLCATILWF